MAARPRAFTLSALAIAALAALADAPALLAQHATGNLFGTVSDEQGARLPGVAVSLTGNGAPRAAAADARGEFRFLNLSPGRYSLAFELQGFVRIAGTDVEVSVGKSTELRVRLTLVNAGEVVTSPLETRSVTTGAEVTRLEMTEIPTARDPWVVLQSVPGVLTDRVNIGGNQSGQQSNYVGNGALGLNNVWNLDGVNITDVAAAGSTGMHFDFDSFQEINATTGGADLAQMSPGVQLNLVTKRGTNDVHGSARVFLARKQWESQNLTPELIAQGSAGGNRIDQVQDYGVEVGGPLWKDRAWLWGAYGRNQIDLIAVGGTPDKTTLEAANLKLNLQLTDSTSATASHTQGDKIKLGRSVGVTRPPETAWNQSGTDGKPSALDKVELSQVISEKLFLTASYASFRGGFQLVPQGGLLANNVYQDAGGVWHNSYSFYKTRRPQNAVTAGSSYFLRTGSTGHEFKFGFSYRKAGVDSQSGWPGNGNYGLINPYGTGRDVAVLTRQFVEKGQLFSYGGYAGDTITVGNATINAGLRYDLQYGHNSGTTVPANPVVPDILPALDGPDELTRFKWKTWLPRVGVTYSIGPDKKGLLKASYARFADQLGIVNVFHDNDAQLAGIGYYWLDVNHDHAITRNELDFSDGMLFTFGLRCLQCSPPNSIDPNLKAGVTDEFVAGFDYEVMPELVVSTAYTHRKYSGAAVNRPGFAFFDPTFALKSSDFHFVRNVTGTLFDGTTVSQPLYGLNAGVFPPGGTVEINRPGWSSTYDGIELAWEKRLSNRWMMRGNLTWNTWKQRASAGGCADPTNALDPTFGTSCPSNGADIMVAPSGTSSGNFAGVFINARWSFNVSGLYELPWGFRVAANLYGREGYPFLQWIDANPGDGLGTRSVLVSPMGAYRHPSVFDADLRLEKLVSVSPVQVNLSVDVFNVANASTVLQRIGKVNSSSYNVVTETLNPRIVRAGARVSF